MKSISKILILILVSMMLLTSCETDDKKEENKATATPTPTATAKPTPTLDPSVDYSQWGKHGFERLLPIPLPFSDEEADWGSRKTSESTYQISNARLIILENPEDIVKIFQEYAKSFEAYGYTVNCHQSFITAIIVQEKVISFNCSTGKVAITISLAS